MASLQRDLSEFIGLLNSAGVEYVLVAGTAENVRRVLTVLEEFGFGSVGVAAADLGPGRVIRLGRPPNRIGLLSSISGVPFDEAWRGRVESDLDGEPVAFLGLAELLRNTRSSRRPKDLADVAALESVARAGGHKQD